MSSIRRRIRAKIAEGLRCAQTMAATNVYSNSFRPILRFLEESAGAVINVHALTDQADDDLSADNPREYRRVLEVSVVCAVSRILKIDAREGDADDCLDELCDQVEQWFYADPTLGFGADSLPNLKGVDSLYRRTEVLETPEGSNDYGSARVVFAVTYHQLAPEGNVAELGPLQGAGVKWDLPPKDGQLEAVDELQLQGA